MNRLFFIFLSFDLKYFLLEIESLELNPNENVIIPDSIDSSE